MTQRPSPWLWTAALALALFAQTASAQSAPQLINYQGRLTDSAGVPLDGVNVSLTFGFYTAPTGGATLLTVEQLNVAVSQGIYNVLIGSGTVTPGAEQNLAAVFQKHAEVWLGVRVNTDPEMTPRARISSAPYALALDAWFLGDFLGRPDWDGDGVAKADIPPDCNDGAAATYPGASEVCDTRDNQCPGYLGYGFIDEGCPGVCTDQDTDTYFFETGCGLPADCNDLDALTYPSAPETCDGLDNDCNLLVDDAIAPQSCYTGFPGTLGVGVCHGGTEDCIGGALVCVGEVTPQPEICNDADDDCNSIIDDNIPPDPCYNGPPATQGVGACHAGVDTCTAGGILLCLGEVTPLPEACNNQDDDCNGATDDGLASQGSCYTGPPPTLGVGVCHAGNLLCAGGVIQCIGEVTPQWDYCNYADDDCDGLMDENTWCGDYYCEIPCEDEWSCPDDCLY